MTIQTPVSVMTAPQQIDQLHPAENCHDSTKHTQHDIERRHLNYTASQQEHGLITKSRERCETTEHPGKQQEPRARRKRS